MGINRESKIKVSDVRGVTNCPTTKVHVSPERERRTTIK